MKKLDNWKESKSSFDFNEQLVYKQIKRNKQKVFFKRILQACACIFALIFTLANTSTTYIQATKDIPLLGELNELFSLNKNMLVAIENDYIQDLNIKKEENGIDIEVDYMVVDEKSIYLFYQVSKDGVRMNYAPDEYKASIQLPVDEGSYSSEFDETDEHDILHFEVLTFVDEMVNFDNFDFIITYNENDIIMNIPIDQTKIAKRQVYEVNDVVDIQGQELMIEKVEVYPLSTRIYTRQNVNNTHIINNIKFELEIAGKVREKEDGVQAAGITNDEEKGMVYYLPSSYFLGNNFEILIKEAELILKPGEVYYDLQTNTFNDVNNVIKSMEVYTKEKHPSIYDTVFENNEYVVLVKTKEELKDRGLFAWSWLGSNTSFIDNDSNKVYEYIIKKAHEGMLQDNQLIFELSVGEKIEVNQKVKLK